MKIYTPEGPVSVVADEHFPQGTLRLMTDRVECPLVEFLGPMELRLLQEVLTSAYTEGRSVYRVLLAPRDYGALEKDLAGRVGTEITSVVGAVSTPNAHLISPVP